MSAIFGPRRPVSTRSRNGGWTRGVLQVSRGRDLATGYSDEDIEAMATEDGDAEVFTCKWGQENREPRAIQAANEAANAGAHVIGHELHGQLPTIDRELAVLAVEHPLAEARVEQTAEDRTNAVKARDKLAKQFRREGLGTPKTSKRHLLAEILLLATLGAGDLILISLAFQVLGLSDKPLLKSLPVSELQLAASTSVAALLITARIAGHRLRRAAHFTSLFLQTDEKDPDARHRHLAVAVDAGTEVGIALGGITAILVGVNSIRGAYLAQKGIPAHGSSFLAIQAGIAASGILLAAWYAHPHEHQWRTATEAWRTAEGAFKAAVAHLTELVKRHNQLLVARDHLVAQYLEFHEAHLADARRLPHLYARRHQLSLPEPTTETIFPEALPMPTGAAWATSLQARRDADEGKAIGHQPKPLDLASVVDKLRELNQNESSSDEETTPKGRAAASNPVDVREPVASNGRGQR